MYLSRVPIDVKKYETMKALYNVERLHGMIERSFLGKRQRNLWRLDQLAGKDYLLLLSAVPPQTNTLPEQIGYDNCAWETKSYERLLARISTGSKWHFRLTANPTVAIQTKEKERGKVKAITIAAKQREWLRRQGDKKGFFLQESQFDVVQSEWKTINKCEREIQVLAVTFEGILTVTDEDMFRETLISGIGREKAYGMGLLTVVQHD